MRQKECKIEERRYGSRNHGLWFRFKTKSKNGGRVTKVAQVFGIGGGSIYRWLERKELAATKVKYRQRQGSLDIRELSIDIQENLEARLKQRAEKIGVTTSAIFKAIKKMKMTRKKQSYLIAQRSK